MNEPKFCNPRSNQPPASPRTSPLTYSPPPPTPHREITAAVEVDFGAGPYERVEIRYGEDPVKLARQFCADKGFSQTIMMPLAVKLAQALDKAKRQAADIAKTGPKVAHGKINSARQKAKAEEARRQKEEMASKLFKRLDQNGDGDVSIAELQEALLKSSETVRMLGLTSIIVFDPKTDKMVVQRDALTEFLRRWDGDGNGVLSKAEFSRMFQLKDKPKGKKYSAFSSTNYREYDRDKMEEEEARQLQRERFALRKYGKDGLILDDWVRHVTSKPKKFVFGAGPGKRKEFEEDIQKLREKNKEKYPDELQPPGQVFDKLYTKAMEKKERERTIEKQKEESEVMAAQAAKNTRKSVMSKVSRELMRNRTAGEYSSYNERLYAEASQRMEARKEMSRRAREERERDELKEVTMQPEISAYAKHLKRPEAAWEKLGDGSKVREKYGKLAEIKMEMEKKELRDCTFRPKINAKSKEMMRGRLDNLRDRGLNHHDQLYFDANRRQMRQEEYEAWKASEHTFYPNAHRVVEEAGEGGVDADHDLPKPFAFQRPHGEPRSRGPAAAGLRRSQRAAQGEARGRDVRQARQAADGPRAAVPTEPREHAHPRLALRQSVRIRRQARAASHARRRAAQGGGERGAQERAEQGPGGGAQEAQASSHVPRARHHAPRRAEPRFLGSNPRVGTRVAQRRRRLLARRERQARRAQQGAQRGQRVASGRRVTTAVSPRTAALATRFPSTI